MTVLNIEATGLPGAIDVHGGKGRTTPHDLADEPTFAQTQESFRGSAESHNAHMGGTSQPPGPNVPRELDPALSLHSGHAPEWRVR